MRLGVTLNVKPWCLVRSLCPKPGSIKALFSPHCVSSGTIQFGSIQVPRLLSIGRKHWRVVSWAVFQIYNVSIHFKYHSLWLSQYQPHTSPNHRDTRHTWWKQPQALHCFNLLQELCLLFQKQIHFRETEFGCWFEYHPARVQSWVCVGDFRLNVWIARCAFRSAARVQISCMHVEIQQVLRARPAET